MKTAQVFCIPAVNMVRLRQEIGKMNKRAERLNLEPIQLNELRVFSRTETDFLGYEYDRTYHEVSVVGQKPKLSGWSMVAAIEPQNNSENMVREVPGETCPAEYRKTDLHCDHCNSVRRRSVIYVLRCDEKDDGQGVGDYRQVGRKCLADFLGGASPESLLNAASNLWNLSNLCHSASEYEWGVGEKQVPDVEITRYVTVVCSVIRACGWIPRSRAEGMATADIAWHLTMYGHSEYARELVQQYNIRTTDADTHKARVALEWGRNISPTNASNTFLHNLGVCCRQVCADNRTCGTIAALISAYERFLSAELERKSTQSTSHHIGTVGDKHVFEDVAVAGKHSYETVYGTQLLFRFVDREGNVIVWKTMSDPDWMPEIGQRFTLKATIKKHDSWNNIPQTVIIRATPIGEA